MIFNGECALTLDHERKLAERFKVSTALFVGVRGITYDVLQAEAESLAERRRKWKIGA